MFSFKALKGLFDFGWKVTLVGLIHMTYTNIYGLIIGKVYTKEDLAFVNKSHSIPGLVMGVISSTVCSVSFPALSQMQDDRERMRSAMSRMIQSTSFWVFPLMTGLAICADDVILLFFGEQWLSCVPYMRLACFSFALQPFHDINLQAIAAMGKSEVFLNLQLIKTGFGCLMIVLFLRHGVWLFMAILAFVSGPVSLYVNTWHNRRFVKYSLANQIKDVLPMVVVCIGMAVCVLGVEVAFYRLPQTMLISIIKLSSQFFVGLFVYLSLSAFFRIAAMGEYLHIVTPTLVKAFPNSRCLIDRIVARVDSKRRKV